MIAANPFPHSTPSETMVFPSFNHIFGTTELGFFRKQRDGIQHDSATKRAFPSHEIAEIPSFSSPCSHHFLRSQGAQWPDPEAPRSSSMANQSPCTSRWELGVGEMGRFNQHFLGQLMGLQQDHHSSGRLINILEGLHGRWTVELVSW